MPDDCPSAPLQAYRLGRRETGERSLPEECAVALVYDGASHAVMMATPRDLEDFALGFSLAEGIVERLEEIEEIDTVDRGPGLELRLWLCGMRGEALAARRRHMTGPSGCGLCGLESLRAATQAPPRVAAGGPRLSGETVLAAMEELSMAQVLYGRTRGTHAAGFWTPAAGLVCLREDVGRHNALDKLAGALARQGCPAAEGAVLITSRVSVEMVQKTAVLGAPLLIAVSAPTSLAVETAAAAGITLAAVARRDGFEVFTHPERFALP